MEREHVNSLRYQGDVAREGFRNLGVATFISDRILQIVWYFLVIMSSKGLQMT